MIRPPEELRAEEWRLLSPEARLEFIQDFENGLAASEGRVANSVGVIFGGELNMDDSPIHRGSQYKDELGREHIDIAAPFLRADQPYPAMETYLHEARHAFQKAAVADPSLHTDPNQVKAWENNQIEAGGYISPKENPIEYRGQPVEADANAAARQRMDEIYQGHFSEQEGYETHKTMKLDEAAHYAKQATMQLGPDYAQQIEKEVRQRAQEYERSQHASVETLQEDAEQKRGLEFGL